MPSPLDDLALALTSPISRRRALSLTAAATVTSFFGLRTGTGTAQGACPSCPRASDPDNYSQFCGHPRGVGCLFVCCPPEYTCCQTDTVVVCCREGYECGPIVNGGHTCRCKNDCGGACCKPDETCVNSELGLCCQGVGCGEKCCRAGEKCVDPSRGVCCKSTEKGCIGQNQTICCDADYGRCCAGSTRLSVTSCCGLGQTCTDQGLCKCTRARPVDCHDTECCKRSEKCCETPSGGGRCIPSDWRCCGETAAGPWESCCAGRFPYVPAFQRCCGVTGICPKNAECCPDGCCPEGTSCCNRGCCNAAGARVAVKSPFMRVRSRERLRDRRRAMRRDVRRSAVPR